MSSRRSGPPAPAGVVVDDGGEKGRDIEVQLADPPVLARAKGDAQLGAEVTVRVVAADVAAGAECSCGAEGACACRGWDC